MNQPLGSTADIPTLDDERLLVERATQGDHDAFGKLYDRFVAKIYRYIFFRIGSRNDAEDLTAQVFLRAWQAIGRYEWTGRPFAAWIFRIAHNAIVDHFRMRRETVPLDERLPNQETFGDLDQVTNRLWTAQVLQRALARLTDDQQQVIVLRFVEGLDTHETAQIMDRQEGAVRTLQHRALVKLRDSLRAAPKPIDTSLHLVADRERAALEVALFKRNVIPSGGELFEMIEGERIG